MSNLDDIVQKLAVRYDVPAAHIHALIAVESGGTAFTTVKDRFGQVVRFPLYRHEGHYFHKLLKGAQQAAAVAARLASPKAQAIANPGSQQARFTKLFEPACAISRPAAIAAGSWGVGQVMGDHWKRLGFNSAEAFYDHAGTLEGQIDLIIRYIESARLLVALRKGQWTILARGYNGPNYRRFQYDTKLAAAAKRYGGTVHSGAVGMLQMGAKGPKVRELQRLLGRAGFSIKVESDFGPTTEKAVRRFQKAAGVEVDGVVGPETMDMLRAFRQTAKEDLTKVEIANLPNLGKIAGGAMGAVASAGTGLSVEKINEVKQTVEIAAEKVQVVATWSPMFERAADYLMMGAGGLGLAALVWGGIELVKSRRSYDGVSA